MRAGIVNRPEEYHWSSYRFYLAREAKPQWLSLEWLLQEYGTTYRAAQRKYRQFVVAGIESSPGYPVDHVVGQAVLGSKEFIGRVVEGIDNGREIGDVISKRHYVQALDLQTLYEAVCGHYGEREITKGRGGGRSRDMFVYLAKKHTTALNGEIGQKAGGVTFSAVTQRHSREDAKGGRGKERKAKTAETAYRVVEHNLGTPLDLQLVERTEAPEKGTCTLVASDEQMLSIIDDIPGC